jgi:VWFA-related protein
MIRRISFLVALVALILSADTPPADKPPADTPPADPSVVFRSDVSLVRVDAQVVDRNNRAIPGLRMEDFILREDGKQQEIRNFSSEKMPVDVVLLLDVSGSMQPHVQRIASAAHQALRVLGDEDRVAIMVFDRSTRVRLPFRNSRYDVERELESLLYQETFDGGTDITRGLLDAANYMARHARRDARRAIVILTDDQTERDRDDAGVLRALTRADSVLSALIAPDALHTGTGGMGRMPRSGGSWPGRGPLGGPWGGIIIPRGPSGGRGGGSGPVTIGGRTHSAGTSEIARRSGGDSMDVQDASALEDTLARIRQRYALYFYLPAGVKPGEERGIEVELTNAALRRYPGAEVRYRRSYMAPNGSSGAEDTGPTIVSRPQSDRPDAPSVPVADTDRPRLRRRPGTDQESVGSRQGPIGATDTAEPQGGWRRADDGSRKSDASSRRTDDSSPRSNDSWRRVSDGARSPEQPASADQAPAEGRWRRVKPGEQE